jgi:hypothetical protein
MHQSAILGVFCYMRAMVYLPPVLTNGALNAPLFVVLDFQIIFFVLPGIFLMVIVY